MVILNMSQNLLKLLGFEKRNSGIFTNQFTIKQLNYTLIRPKLSITVKKGVS